jgi:hypothetical protein
MSTVQKTHTTLCWICERLIVEPPAWDLSGKPVHPGCKPMADEAIRWDENKRIRL